jgi:hypothetical protein
MLLAALLLVIPGVLGHRQRRQPMLSMHDPNFVLRRQILGLIEASQAEFNLVVDEGRHSRSAYGAKAPNIATGGAPIACFSH